MRAVTPTKPAKTKTGTFVLVVGHTPDLARDESAASNLKQLGAQVRTLDFWDDADEAFQNENNDTCRAIVIEAGERPDFATSSLRGLRKDDRLREAPALVVFPERQVARLEPGAGFDDFIVAPVRAVELYARIRKLEWQASEFVTDERVKVGGMVIDRASREVTLDGRRISLTAKEFNLLAFLAANRGRVFGRDVLLARVWGARYEGGARTVDIHVRRLRAKFGNALPLETLRGAGYKLLTPQARESESSIQGDDEEGRGEKPCLARGSR
ncbi:MAG: winged helix-turn-helix domain-containing protein [Polyangiaceae bacterium]